MIITKFIVSLKEEVFWRVIFIYEALSSHQKRAIDREIRKGLEKMVLSNGGLNYSDYQFNKAIYELVISNEVISELLGDNSPPYFSLKEIVIKSRARKMMKEYVGLHRILRVNPSIELLFSIKYTEGLVCTFNQKIKKRNGESKEIVDNFCSNVYNISSNIKSFEKSLSTSCTLKEELPVYVTATRI